MKKNRFKPLSCSQICQKKKYKIKIRKCCCPIIKDRISDLFPGYLNKARIVLNDISDRRAKLGAHQNRRGQFSQNENERKIEEWHLILN